MLSCAVQTTLSCNRYILTILVVVNFSRSKILFDLNSNIRFAKVLANLPSPKLKDQVINPCCRIQYDFYSSWFQVLEEIDKLCEQNEELMHPLTNVHYNQSPGNGMFNSVHTPIMKSLPSLYPSLAPTKTNNLGLTAPSAPEPEEPSPAYHNSWAHGTISPPSGDMKDSGAGAGSSESGESNSTSTEV